MNKPIARAVAAAISLAFSAGAAAQGMSKADYDAGKAGIAADYKSARAVCAPMSGDDRIACRADARSKRKAALADLNARNARPAAAKGEGAQEYVDDSVITAKVKTAVFEDPTLKSAEINVETYKGIVQLSGFVRSRGDINRAVEVARGVRGVTSVKNVMIVKGQQ